MDKENPPAAAPATRQERNQAIGAVLRQLEDCAQPDVDYWVLEERRQDLAKMVQEVAPFTKDEQEFMRRASIFWVWIPELSTTAPVREEETANA